MSPELPFPWAVLLFRRGLWFNERENDSVDQKAMSTMDKQTALFHLIFTGLLFVVLVLETFI